MLLQKCFYFHPCVFYNNKIFAFIFCNNTRGISKYVSWRLLFQTQICQFQLWWWSWYKFLDKIFYSGKTFKWQEVAELSKDLFVMKRKELRLDHHSTKIIIAILQCTLYFHLAVVTNILERHLSQLSSFHFTLTLSIMF